MRVGLVRRRGQAWKEAALKAASQPHPGPPKDKWSDLLNQLKTTPRACDYPACRGGHQPGQPHDLPPPIRRESKSAQVQRAAKQEEEFQGFTTKLLILLGLLLAGLTALALYTLFSSPTLLSTPPAPPPDT